MVAPSWSILLQLKVWTWMLSFFTKRISCWPKQHTVTGVLQVDAGGPVKIIIVTPNKEMVSMAILSFCEVVSVCMWVATWTARHRACLILRLNMANSDIHAMLWLVRRCMHYMRHRACKTPSNPCFAYWVARVWIVQSCRWQQLECSRRWHPSAPQADTITTLNWHQNTNFKQHPVG